MMPYYSPYSFNPGTIFLVCFLLSLVTAIVLLAVFLPIRKQNQYSGFSKSLYNFLNFQSFWISPIIKLLYMTLALTFVLSGLIILFVEPLAGLGLMIFGIIIRLFFEMGYIMYAMLDQLKQINSKMGAANIEAPPSCPQCGKTIDANQAFCNHCGAKLNN